MKEMKWKIQDVGRLLKDCFLAILKGQFLLRLNIGRYFIHIVYVFFLFAMLIWYSLRVDSTLSRIESNKKLLKELEIKHSNMEFELRTLNRRITIDEMLQKSGSKVTETEAPATVLKK